MLGLQAIGNPYTKLAIIQRKTEMARTRRSKSQPSKAPRLRGPA
jgi:hypothetical protein